MLDLSLKSTLEVINPSLPFKEVDHSMGRYREKELIDHRGIHEGKD